LKEITKETLTENKVEKIFHKKEKKIKKYSTKSGRKRREKDIMDLVTKTQG
jgi:hypothetical protein